MDAMIALNITVLTRLTYGVAPRFVARGKSTILDTSIVGISPETLNGVYGATKAYVVALSKEIVGRHHGAVRSFCDHQPHTSSRLEEATRPYQRPESFIVRFWLRKSV